MIAFFALQGHPITWLNTDRVGGKRVSPLVLLVSHVHPIWPGANTARNGAFLTSMVNDNNGYNYCYSRARHNNSGYD
ncbi:MAG: hypothetical protein JO145_12815 [Acidobacteriaceae bacterium]|nr:hypothetical protein [Acidobacteriaceae bacterium]MBV9296443.1 hypothetical protein [Acidobacteriaceae bacterium]